MQSSLGVLNMSQFGCFHDEQAQAHNLNQIWLYMWLFACIPAWSDEIRDDAKGGRMSKWYPGMDRHRAPVGHCEPRGVLNQNLDSEVKFEQLPSRGMLGWTMDGSLLVAWLSCQVLKWWMLMDLFQDFCLAEEMKPCKTLLKILNPKMRQHSSQL